MPMLIGEAWLLEKGGVSKEEIDLLVKRGISIPFQEKQIPCFDFSRPTERRRERGALRAHDYRGGLREYHDVPS